MPKVATRKKSREQRNIAYFRKKNPTLFSARVVLTELKDVPESLGAYEEFAKENEVEITSKKEFDTVHAGVVKVINLRSITKNIVFVFAYAPLQFAGEETASRFTS